MAGAGKTEECISKCELLKQNTTHCLTLGKKKKISPPPPTVQEMGKSKIRVLANLAIDISICDMPKKKSIYKIVV